MKRMILVCSVLALCASLALAQGQQQPAPMGGQTQGHDFKAAVVTERGELLPEAKLVAEVEGLEPIRPVQLPDGTWYVTGAGERTILHVKDPNRGTVSVEVALPTGQALVEIRWGEKTATAVVTALPEPNPAGLQSIPSVSPGLGVIGQGSREDCPAGSLFAQPPHGPDDAWSFGTSENDASGDNYLRAESFSVSGEICDIHWWGAQLYYDPIYGWLTCTESNPLFEIKFYADAGGAPGAEVCSYTVTPTITETGILYAGFVPLKYYSVDLLDPCCTLANGWVSIQGFGDTTCWFLWCSSSVGNGSSYFLNNGVPEAYFYDNSLCLTGEYVPVYGACCDDSTGICVDDVEQMDCAAGSRFAANTLCADLDPPCGEITTCEHSIVLTDDYGDGWNGGTVDVLVNGAIVLDNLTLSSGAGPVVYYFQAATDDAISTVYVPGSWAYENEYHIYDVNGTEICAAGVGGTQPTGGPCGLGYCGGDPCEGNWPVNDSCEDATPINAPYPQTVSGSNYCAQIDCPGILDWHSTWWEIELPYAMNNLHISFCGNGFEINNIGAVVYNDCTDCPAYILYDMIDWYSCADGVTSPQLDWLSLPGPGTVLFPVYYNEDTMGPYAFEVDVTEFVVPENDLCENAVAVDVPSTTAGTTVGASTDSGFPYCGTSITSPGVWYWVTGTGNTMTASLCNGVATWDTKLCVYCPDCIETICVDGNDDFCGVQSEVSWCSQFGANYLVLVHGYGGVTGPFELDVYDDGAPCQGAVACLPEGACCLLTGECVIINAFGCEALGGEYQGDDTICGVTFDTEKARQDCNDHIIGMLDSSSPIWDRIWGCDVDPNCNASCSDSASNGQYYAAFAIGVAVEENFEAEVLAAGTTISDTVMTLYCDPFDPADPLSNVVALDDDGGDGLLSAFFVSDGILLQPGQTYWLVLCTYSAGYTGDFDICLRGTAFVGTPEPGACCLPDGTCENMEAADCVDAGGIFGGGGTDCATYECPEIIGACCLPDSTCVLTIETCCTYAGGIFVGPNTNCGTELVTFFAEDFNDGIPAGWMITDDAGTGLKWATNDFWGDSNWTGGDGLCAEASSDTYGSSVYDTSLVSPLLDLTGVFAATLDFEANYQWLSSDEYFEVYVSYDGGGTWTNLLSWNEDHGTFHGTPGEHVSLALDGGSAQTMLRFRYYDPTSSWNWEIELDDLAITAEVQVLSPCQDLDIKPGSCPNPLNPTSKGVIPVALLGTPEFDVTLVDLATLRLSRADGVGGEVAPHEGPPGPHTVVEDVATPFYGEGCECHQLGGDGIPDLSMKFRRTNEVAEILGLTMEEGGYFPLVLRGNLLDGTPFVASDCIVLVGHGYSQGSTLMPLKRQ